MCKLTIMQITGANGHVGFQIVATALKAGYKVRAAVRQASAGAQIKAAKSVQPYLQSLEIAIVPDMIKDGAFDDAVAEMEYVIHVAFPMAHGPVS
jgi:nucleoside-diphosphate-sugar epimerase